LLTNAVFLGGPGKKTKKKTKTAFCPPARQKEKNLVPPATRKKIFLVKDGLFKNSLFSFFFKKRKKEKRKKKRIIMGLVALLLADCVNR
jgi:hypothetical protein